MCATSYGPIISYPLIIGAAFQKDTQDPLPVFSFVQIYS